MSSVAVPENSAGIPSSPLLYNFQDPSQAYYTGHVERKPYSMWLGGVGQVNDQWIEIELAEVTELEQLWIWNWNDLPEVGRQANSFEIQVSTVTTTPGQLGNVTWDTTFANDFSETTGGGVPDRPVDFVQTFPEGTFSRYIRINDIDHLGPASGGDNYLGLGPVFVFEASAGPLLELTGLEPDTTFRARIRANDGDMTSNWLEVDKFFTTLPASSESPIGEVGQITHLTHQTQTVMLSRTYNTPVVFAQSPSDNGKTAVAVRVKDVLSDRFSVFLEEPSNEDGIHAAETITYVVLESGEHSLLDGTRLEVGTVLTNATVGKLVPSQWETVSFATSFPDTPVLLSQIQTNAGIDYLQVRQNQITPSGAELALEQQENISAPYPTTERIGYLAIEQGVSRWNGLPFEANNTAMAVTQADYSQSFLGNYASPPRLLSSLSSYGGKDSAHVRYKTLSASGVAFRVGEDQTADAEQTHGAETVAYLAIGGTGTLTAALPQVTVGETGKITNLTHVEQTVILENSYSNPVVFAQSLSYNGTDPALVRVKNVQSDRFTAYITEPSNENGMHGVGEEMSYVVLESGKHTLSDGRRLEVGRVTTAATVGQLLNNQWETVGFSTNFSVAPAVFSQIQTAVGEAYLQTRQSNVTASAVDIALEQEEAATGVHGSETIGYLAVESGSGAWNHLLFEVSHTANVVSDQWFDQDFGVAFGKAPNLLSSLTTYSDADAAHVRYGSLDRNSVRLRVEEDTSTDTEVVHGAETIAYLAIGGDGTLAVAPPVNPPRVTEVERDDGQQTFHTLEKLTFTFDQDVFVDVNDLTL
ncbi:MAG: hypothetical protein MK179_16160, partial [Pirellulaceae bacterium]|nr:hypothetical protein [Pirellulaceae bacterium]